MKRLKVPFAAILSFIIISCAPATKDSYLKKYAGFIESVKNNHSSYSEKDWLEADEEYTMFNDEWYGKFSDEMTISDKATILKYQAQYKYYRFESDFSKSWDEFINNDVEDMKERIEFYIENDMEKDLKKVWEKAQKAGDTAIERLREIFRELGEDWDQYINEDEDTPDQI